MFNFSCSFSLVDSQLFKTIPHFFQLWSEGGEWKVSLGRVGESCAIISSLQTLSVQEQEMVSVLKRISSHQTSGFAAPLIQDSSRQGAPK